MLIAEVAESQTAIARLEGIRQLNARSGWVNLSLYRLMFSPNMYILAYERIKSEPGNRREKSCHSALQEIQRQWTGVVWFVEGDIQNCFDDIDHETLVNIREKIKDERFINLIRKILKAGYQDLDEVRKDSLAGTPQGGIVSPILANIYLHKLDEFVEQTRDELERGGKRKLNLEYKRLQDRRLYLAKQGKTRSRKYKELGIRMQKLPSMDTRDPDFVRIKYIRYAGDWLIGVTGPYQLAEQIKQKVRDFLRTELKLTLSERRRLSRMPEPRKQIPGVQNSARANQ